MGLNYTKEAHTPCIHATYIGLQRRSVTTATRAGFEQALAIQPVEIVMVSRSTSVKPMMIEFATWEFSLN